MASVFRRLYYHTVWTTKNREACLVEALHPTLYDAVHATCRRLECQVHGVKAVADHVHLVLEIPPSRAVAFVLGQIKGASSHALNVAQPGSGHWQEGYGAVTFRRADLKQVLEYLATQEERHCVGQTSPFLETCEDREPDVGEDPLPRR